MFFIYWEKRKRTILILCEYVYSARKFKIQYFYFFDLMSEFFHAPRPSFFHRRITFYSSRQNWFTFNPWDPWDLAVPLPLRESIEFNELRECGRARARARVIRSLFTPRGKRAVAGAENRREGRVVVSRARRGIIYPTKVAALRQESKDRPWLHYSGRRSRAFDTRVRGGEPPAWGRRGGGRCGAGALSRARFLARVSSLLLHLSLRRAVSSSSSSSFPPSLPPTSSAPSLVSRLPRDVSPTLPRVPFGLTNFLFRPFLFSSLCHVPSNLRPPVFIHPYRPCQTRDLRRTFYIKPFVSMYKKLFGNSLAPL